MEKPISISSRLRRIMEQRNYSLRSLAKDTGLSHVTILRVANNKYIGKARFETLVKLANVLNVPVEYLYRVN